MKLGKKKIAFEDDIPNMITKTNHNLLTQTIENKKRMEYYEQILKLIARVNKELIKNTPEIVAIFLQSYFMHKGLNNFGREGRDVLTKEMDQFNRKMFLGLYI